MHPIQAHQLYDLASGAHAAAFAAKATDDIEQRYGLIAATEQLTGELKRIAWQYVESAELDEERPRIDPAIARSLNPDANLSELAEAIHQATGRAIDRIRSGSSKPMATPMVGS